MNIVERGVTEKQKSDNAFIDPSTKENNNLLQVNQHYHPSSSKANGSISPRSFTSGAKSNRFASLQLLSLASEMSEDRSSVVNEDEEFERQQAIKRTLGPKPNLSLRGKPMTSPRSRPGLSMNTFLPVSDSSASSGSSSPTTPHSSSSSSSSASSPKLTQPTISNGNSNTIGRSKGKISSFFSRKKSHNDEDMIVTHSPLLARHNSSDISLNLKLSSAVTNNGATHSNSNPHIPAHSASSSSSSPRPSPTSTSMPSLNLTSSTSSTTTSPYFTTAGGNVSIDQPTVVFATSLDLSSSSSASTSSTPSSSTSSHDRQSTKITDKTILGSLRRKISMAPLFSSYVNDDVETPSSSPSPSLIAPITASISGSSSFSALQSKDPVYSMIQSSSSATSLSVSKADSRSSQEFDVSEMPRQSSGGRMSSTNSLCTRVWNPIFEPRMALVKLLTGEKFGILSALCKTVEIWLHDELANALLLLFGSCRQLPRLLNWAIASEFSSHKEGSSDVFRGSGLGIRLVSNYIGFEGVNYLQHVIGPHVRKICLTNISMELDPGKLLPNEDLKTNQDNIMNFCASLIDDIFKSMRLLPLSIRMLFSTLKKRGLFRTENWQSSNGVINNEQMRWNTVAGSLFFLRFICPALVSPDRYCLTQGSPSPTSRRALILTSKILQSISNSCGNLDDLDEKENYMRGITSFIGTFKETLTGFFSELAEVPEQIEVCSPWVSHWAHPHPRFEGTMDMANAINVQLRMNQDKIQAILESTSKRQKAKTVNRFKRYSVRWVSQPTPRAKLLSKVHQEIRLRSQLNGIISEPAEIDADGLIKPSTNPTMKTRDRQSKRNSMSLSSVISLKRDDSSSTSTAVDNSLEDMRKTVLALETQLNLMRLALETERLEKNQLKVKYRSLKQAYKDLHQRQQQQHNNLKRIINPSTKAPT